MPITYTVLFQMATFNWIITCGCTNPTEYHCNTCGENLCSSCKQTHLQNYDTRHHSVVEYTKRLTPGSLSILLCHEHNGKECVCWCQTCVKAACIGCVTKSHRGHEFAELETVLQQKRTSMQKELNNLESNVLNEWQNLMNEAKKVTSNFLDRVNLIEEELAERAKEFHKKVDEIMQNYKKELNELKTSNLAVLLEQEKNVSQGLEKVKQEAKEYEDRLRSSNTESVLKHDIALHKRDLLPTISCETPLFIPSQIDIKTLTEMFGQLTVPKTTQGAKGQCQSKKSSTKDTDKIQIVPETTQSTALRHGRPVEASTGDTQTHGTTAPIKPPTQLIPKPSIQSGFRNKTEFPSVACVGSSLAWVKTADRTIQLVDRHGTVKDTIHTDFIFHDMVLSPQGNILLTDKTNDRIKSISGDKKKVKTLFKLDGKFHRKPDCLCCLHSGETAVTFCNEGCVVIYSRSGKVIIELDKKLFRRPYSVAQNKVNRDLYISDILYEKVVVLDEGYRVRYEYTGQRDRGSFSPRGLCTDNAGHVLITDHVNDRVDILDRDRQFLQYLLTGEQGLRGPWSIDVDSEGNAWVGDWNGVKVVKYLQ